MRDVALWKAAAWALITGAALAGPVQAQHVRAQVSVDSVTVGERFALTIQTDYPAPLQPVFPDPGDSTLALGDLELIARQTFHREDGRIDRVVYEAAAFAVDTAFVPPIEVAFLGGADTLTAATEPLYIPMRSLVPPEAQEVRDLAPLVSFPRTLWPWILAGLLLLLAALLGYYLWRRHRRRTEEAPPVPIRTLTPYEEAVERFRQLERFDLHTTDDPKPFYVELADLLRTYLARRLGVPAMERTTRELVRELHQRTGEMGVPDRLAQRVRSVLDVADLAKYADLRPSADRGAEALREARRAVEAVEADLRPPPQEIPAEEAEAPAA